MNSLPNPSLVTTPPDEHELRGMRKIVRDSLKGEVLTDLHANRGYRYKPAPGKFRSQFAALVSCDRDHVICEIPTNENKADPDAETMRICLICDGGREMLGLNGKPLS